MKTFLRLLVLTPLLFISSCTKDSNPVGTSGSGTTIPPKIITGTETTVATQPLSTAGGRISVASADTLINGLELRVPANAYGEARTFTISYAPIQSHKFDTCFSPISPLITISNGGGYADSMMAVRVPIALPDAAYPVAFFYDDVNQILEPMPMLTFDKHSVTIASRHFDVSGVSSGLGKYGRVFDNPLTSYARYLITMVNKKIVDAIAIAEPVIPTDYLPGVDDWEFVNHGSYIAQGGHCAGQNASSLWYFYEKKKKLHEPPLYHRYDSVNVSPNVLWQDNPLGYRVASGVQVNEHFDALTLKIYEEYVGMQDDWTWSALVLAMHEFHEPFDIGLYGFDSQGKNVGHDVTAYAVDVANRSISIADPNYPGDRTRRVTYNGATFDYYYSGKNAEEPGIPFRTVKFASKTASISWSAIGNLWKSVVVGKQNPGFPTYHLRVENGGYELIDYTTTNSDTLIVSVNWTEPNTACYQVFDRSGTLVTPFKKTYSYSTRDSVALKPGENILGFAIYAAIAPTPPSTSMRFCWNDFQWIHITKTASGPVITSIVPGSAWAGDTVKVKGRNFGADKTKGTVTFSSGVPATQIISWNDTTIAVKVPQGVQSGPVTVTVNNLTSNSVTFTIPTAVSDLLAVAGGTFQMGQSPGPIGQSPGHPVTLGSFKIDKYEITYEKWTEVRNWGLTHGYTDLTSAQNGAAPTSPSNPVTMVSWYQIMRWCNARSEKDGMTPVYYTSNTLTTVYRTGVLDIATDQVKWTANGYRLPTEAEWEFASRGGKTGTNVYSGSNTLGDVAWYHDNSGNHTHQVGTKSPNELGLYDMTGNVYEWCWDFYGEYSTGSQTDPKGPTTGVNRTVRGGSYIDYDYGCPLVTRYSEYPSTTAPILGFRCVQH